MLLTKGEFSRIINIVVREQTKTKNKICGCSSSGRAPPCQGGGSEFEPRHPLQVLRQSRNRLSFFCCVCKSGIENPRRFRLRGFSFVLTEQTYIFKCEQHTYMRIATLLLDRWIYLPTLATRTHMRIATFSFALAFTSAFWQPALTCVLQRQKCTILQHAEFVNAGLFVHGYLLSLGLKKSRRVSTEYRSEKHFLLRILSAKIRVYIS